MRGNKFRPKFKIDFSGRRNVFFFASRFTPSPTTLVNNAMHSSGPLKGEKLTVVLLTLPLEIL